VKDKVGDKLAVGTVGGITNGKMANKLLEEDGLDLVAVGRAFQKNPGLVFAFADDLNVDVRMPNQIGWAVSVRSLSWGFFPIFVCRIHSELWGRALLVVYCVWCADSMCSSVDAGRRS
jgi:hypothetical protein